jgi:hypothetical protein
VGVLWPFPADISVVPEFNKIGLILYGPGNTQVHTESAHLSEQWQTVKPLIGKKQQDKVKQFGFWQY